MSTYYNNNKKNKGYPVGTIVPWSGEPGDVPRGWLACNGTALRKQSYPLLNKVIGTVYGGTETSTTFNLPNLNSGASGVLDITKQMHGYLNRLTDPPDSPDPLPGLNDMHAPDTEILSDDIFWQEVQEGSNGDKPGTEQTNYTSTIDVVGNLKRTDNLSAIFDQINFIPGTLSTTLFPSQRKLSDVHIPSHGHPTTFAAEDGSNRIPFLAISNQNLANNCRNGEPPGAGCVLRQRDSCKVANRPIPGSANTRTPLLKANESGMKQVNTTWRCRRGLPGECGNGYYGGSNLSQRTTGQTQEQGRGPNYDGDGATDGDMFAHIRNNIRYTFTSLDPPREAAFYKKVAPHSHGFLSYTWSSKYYRIITPGLVQDVDTNNVRVNNSTGVNFGTITVNTATPTLSLIYIIKVF